MTKPFLKNEIYTYRIAKVAIVFQSIITTLISMILILALSGEPYHISLLRKLLMIDIIFVALHLIYRVSYSGPRVILHKNEKRVLALHIASSLMALGLTLTLIQHDAYKEVAYVYYALSMWILSLVFGVIFFLKKYMTLRAS